MKKMLFVVNESILLVGNPPTIIKHINVVMYRIKQQKQKVCIAAAMVANTMANLIYEIRHSGDVYHGFPHGKGCIWLILSLLCCNRICVHDRFARFESGPVSKFLRHHEQAMKYKSIDIM
jgi:hypothetical protein